MAPGRADRVRRVAGDGEPPRRPYLLLAGIEPPLARTLEILLEDDGGWPVVVAASANQAQEMLAGENPPAVVITEDSGEWERGSCRSRQEGAPLVVVLSLHPHPPASHPAEDGEAFAVLPLPVGPETLVATVRHALFCCGIVR